MNVLAALAPNPAAVTIVTDSRPDVVVVDLGPGARRFVHSVHEAAPLTPVVALGVPDSDHEIVELAEAGAGGLVMAEESTEDMIATIQVAAHGRLVGASRILSILQRRVSALPAELDATLAPRELEILALLVDGLAPKEIAVKLSIAPRTVRNHIQSIYSKLGVHHRSDAVAWFRNCAESALSVQSSAATNTTA